MFKRLILTGLLFLSLISFAPLKTLAVLDCNDPSTITSSQDAIQCGVDSSDSNVKAKDAPKTVNQTMAEIINLLSLIVGAVAVISVILAGFRYVASGGKQESVTAAKNSLIYAGVGLAVVAMAQFLVHFVIHKTDKATGITQPSIARTMDPERFT